MASWTDTKTVVRERIRKQILNRDAHVCHYCGGEATTVDHIIPISKGGDPLDPENMVAACARCNYSKGDQAEPRHLTRVHTPRPFFRTPPEPSPPLSPSLSPTRRKRTESPFESPEATQ